MMSRPSVLMVGTGEYTTGYVHDGASGSDKSAGVVALSLFDMRRSGKVGRLMMAGTNGNKFPGIRRHLHNVIARVYKDLDVSFRGRYDPALEATVYYVVAESITNAVKHAQASTVAVRAGLRDGAIEVEIRDDGVGGADPRRGTGLIGLRDRVDTLGGTITFASPAGAGTTIRVKLPSRSRDREDPPFRRSDGASARQLASG